MSQAKFFPQPHQVLYQEEFDRNSYLQHLDILCDLNRRFAHIERCVESRDAYANKLIDRLGTTYPDEVFVIVLMQIHGKMSCSVFTKRNFIAAYGVDFIDRIYIKGLSITRYGVHSDLENIIIINKKILYIILQILQQCRLVRI